MLVDLCVCLQTANKYTNTGGETKARKKEHTLEQMTCTPADTVRSLGEGADLLTFETFQLFGQVLFIPIFLVFQVFLTRGERREELTKLKVMRRNKFYRLDIKTETP